MLFEIYPQDPLFRCLLYPGHHEHLCWRSHRYNPGKSIKNMWVTFAFLRKQIQIACTIRKTSGAIISTASAFSTEHPALITRKPSPTTMIIIHIFNDIINNQFLPKERRLRSQFCQLLGQRCEWITHTHFDKIRVITWQKDNEETWLFFTKLTIFFTKFTIFGQNLQVLAKLTILLLSSFSHPRSISLSYKSFRMITILL